MNSSQLLKYEEFWEEFKDDMAPRGMPMRQNRYKDDDKHNIDSMTSLTKVLPLFIAVGQLIYWVAEQQPPNSLTVNHRPDKKIQSQRTEQYPIEIT